MSHREAVDTAATFTAYRVAADHAGAAAATLAGRVWDELDSDRWALEWQLPVWLGEALGLDERVQRALVTSNVLGLASIRVADDLADGDVPADDLPAAHELAAALYAPALAPYRDHFGPDDPFWARVESWMAEWRRATQLAATSRDGAQLSRHLAARGIPLRIPALAMCRLAGRESDYPGLERCLDRALRAMVLYDHALDWREDLAAGRWNAFADGETNPRRVEARLLADGTVGPYFGRIDRELALAVRAALGLRIAGLAVHLSRQRASVAAEGLALGSRYEAVATAATQWLFGQLAT